MNREPLLDQEFDLELESGRVRLRSVGPSTAPLTLFVHGLSAHLHSFDAMIAHFASPTRRLVAVDLRGRGRSEITALGTYGLNSHVRDVLEIATLLGAEHFDIAGWSMGAMIAMIVANLRPDRVGRVVLIDHAGGTMDDSAVAAIRRGLGRLEVRVPTIAQYGAAVRAAGNIAAWSPFWDRYFSYELVGFDDGIGGTVYQPSTNYAACLEDLIDVNAHDWPNLWHGLTVPTLLLRCLRPLGGGFIVPTEMRDGLVAAAAQAEVFEDDTDHFTIMTSERAAHASERFLWGAPPR